MRKHIQYSAANRLAGAALRMSMVVTFSAFIMSGCVAPYPETNAAADQARLQTELSNVKQNVERLQNRLEIIHEEQEHLLREHNRLRDTIQREQNAELDRLRNDTDERFNALDRQREKERREIIEQVTQRIASHLEQATAARAPVAQAARTEHGRYHEVRAGETLSEIAAAYNVRANVIIQANELDNPDRLRIGQRLFIPD